MKILLGMSGGLDSTYAAKLLNEGHTVEGAVLIMHNHSDIEAAQRSASEIGIPLRVIDVRHEFEENVVKHFVSEYANGRTPNPCTVCNPKLKIGKLCEFAASNGFDGVATGHYARKVRLPNGRYAIASGADSKKDQSYMLWGLSQEQIKMLIFPLGELKKSDIRDQARELGYSSAESKESQDVCFIPNGSYVDFVEKRLGSFPSGNFVDVNGNVLGRHNGIIRYTVGQRRGLGIALGCRMFVCAIRPQANEVVLAADGGEPCKKMTVTSLNYQAISPSELMNKNGVEPSKELELLCKIRYAAEPIPVRVRLDRESAEVTFLTPVRAVTPGQSAVFYLPNDDLGGERVIAFGGSIASD